MAVGSIADYVERPWEMDEFQQRPMKKTDRWIMSLWNQGWLVREHSYRRSRTFQPLLGTLLISGEELSGKRVTLAFLDTRFDGANVYEDRWNDRGSSPLPLLTDETKWKGFTFLQRKLEGISQMSYNGETRSTRRSGGAIARGADAG